jgi:hypothetical protein
MLEEGLLPSDGTYKQIVVRLIELSRSRFSRFPGTVSKLNRNPRFIKDLMSHCEARAEEFLTALGFFAGDAQLVLSTPFSDGSVYRGKGGYMRSCKSAWVRMSLDLTKILLIASGSFREYPEAAPPMSSMRRHVLSRPTWWL